MFSKNEKIQIMSKAYHAGLRFHRTEEEEEEEDYDPICWIELTKKGVAGWLLYDFADVMSEAFNCNLQYCYQVTREEGYISNGHYDIIGEYQDDVDLFKVVVNLSKEKICYPDENFISIADLAETGCVELDK